MEETKKIIEEVLRYFEPVNLEVVVIEEIDALRINLKVADAGWLIGKEGEHLRDFEYVLRLLLEKQRQIAKRIRLDINNYRQLQEDRLREIAKEAAHKVAITKKPIRLSGFNAYDRRIIHVELANNPNIITESQGEGENRKLIVKPYP